MKTIRWFLPATAVVITLPADASGPGMGNISRVRAVEAQIRVFETALELYRKEVGRLPTEEEGLRALLVRPENAAGWDGPYLNKRVLPLDPWGNSYVYRNPGIDKYHEVISPGSDGKVGTLDDINNWHEDGPWLDFQKDRFELEEWLLGVFQRCILGLVLFAAILVIRQGRREVNDTISQ